MKTTVDVLALLTSQHDEVDALISKLENGKGDRKALFAQLADKLAAHATAEEKVFYPGVMMKQTDDMLHEAVEEHLQIKRLLADMLDLDGNDEAFDAKLAVLKEQVTHHAREEEEGKLFPLLRKQLDADQLAALGNEVLAMFEEVVAHEPRFDVRDETTEAAPLPAL